MEERERSQPSQLVLLWTHEGRQRMEADFASTALALQCFLLVRGAGPKPSPWPAGIPREWWGADPCALLLHRRCLTSDRKTVGGDSLPQQPSAAVNRMMKQIAAALQDLEHGRLEVEIRHWQIVDLRASVSRLEVRDGIVIQVIERVVGPAKAKQ